ncbi:cation-translocating P-type ATPase [Methanosphaera sp. WGK6]|uniref:heavy metal translocating P-type ATPase n=1 Tax=Methanosphaera sp. WGK6 TaxID=1561964 RepID=UPI000A057FFE|nr:heavy metal translocating P-type ATPase [Methanosphaera sp. WGK6]
MTCVMCSRAVTSAVSKTPGVYSIHVNLVSETADVIYNPKSITIEDIGDKIDSIGYDYMGIHDNNSINNNIIEEKRAKNQRQKIYRIIVGFFFSIILMAIMFGDFGLGENKSYISLAISIIPFIYVAYPIFNSGFNALKNKNLNMDVMYTLGMSVSFVASLLSTFNLLGSSQFMLYDTSIMLGAFLMLGKYLEDRAKSKTSDSINNLINLKATEATVEKMNQDGEIFQEKVDINNVLKGNIVIVKPGEKIPIDGQIIEGTSYVDESLVTGESKPVQKEVGDNVIGGSINKDGSFKIRVTNTGDKTVLSQIISMVQDAQNSSPPIQKLADKAVTLFIPVILIIAIITFIIWYGVFGSPFLYSLSIFISIVVVACPCALGLAIPTALTVGVGLAAKNGILIKDGETLEVSEKITHVLLDKTGTITVGHPELSNIINYSDKSDEEILKISQSIEQYSQHPISSALFNNEEKTGFELYAVEDFENISGKGVKGKINDEYYFIGNKKLLIENNINIPENILNDLEKEELDMKTSIILANTNEVIGIISVEDIIKENSVKAIDELHKMNIKTTMVSGDNKNSSNKIAEKVGITDVVSEVLPQGKLDYVKKLQADGEIVAFIGDGINDAPSLTKSDVGIAIGTGTDVAIESGDIILINGDLLNAVAGIQISKKTMSRVRLNLFWAFAYNIVLIPIAAGVLIPWNIFFRPEFSALAMALSSVTVITLSLLLRRYTPEIFVDE